MQTPIHFESQTPGEKIVHVLRAHPITNVSWILGGVLFLLIPAGFALILIYFRQDVVEVKASVVLAALFVWWLVVLGVLFRRFLLWYYNIYIITNKRVVDIDYFHLFHMKRNQLNM